MLYNLESTRKFREGQQRPVSNELFRSLMELRKTTKERVKGLTGEMMNGDTELFYFEDDSRIIEIQFRETKKTKLPWGRVCLPTDKEIGFCGLQLNKDKRRKSVLDGLLLPLTSNAELKHQRYGFIDSEEIHKITEVIKTGKVVTREYYSGVFSTIDFD
ncbi:MAG: hypothetical protein NTY75_00955 [Candidatus Shapirobacteria bacterium]|nr:hypothetical protein [Candidatus Shapirobacteria bacterium]